MSVTRAVFEALWEKPRTTAEIAEAAHVELEAARDALEELSGAGLAVWTRAELSDDQERLVHLQALRARFHGRHTLSPKRDYRDDPDASPYIDDQERAAPDPDLWCIAPAAARLRRRSATRTATPPHKTTHHQAPHKMSDFPNDEHETTQTKTPRRAGTRTNARCAAASATLPAHAGPAPHVEQLDLFAMA